MRLVEASDAQKRARDALTRDAWDPSLSVAQFQEREAALRAHPWTKQVMATWLWMEGDAVLSSCETFRQPCRLGDEAGFTWAVASVFTEPALRGRGHALSMMRALVARLAREPQAVASVLYSEVGAALYRRAGYLPVPSEDVLLPPRAGAPGVAWCEAPPLPRPVEPAPGVLAIVPTAEELDWHLARERFYVQLRGLKAPAFHGARLGDESVSFALVPKTNELVVLWLDAEAQAAPLLGAAQQVAHDVGAGCVRVWASQPLPEVPGAIREVRDDALPMYAPLRDGVAGWRHIQRGLWV